MNVFYSHVHHISDQDVCGKDKGDNCNGIRKVQVVHGYVYRQKLDEGHLHGDGAEELYSPTLLDILDETHQCGQSGRIQDGG